MSELSAGLGPRAFPVSLLREAIEVCEERSDVSACFVLLVSTDGNRYWAENCAVDAKDLLWGLNEALAKIHYQMAVGLPHE